MARCEDFQTFFDVVIQLSNNDFCHCLIPIVDQFCAAQLGAYQQATIGLFQACHLRPHDPVALGTEHVKLTLAESLGRFYGIGDQLER